MYKITVKKLEALKLSDEGKRLFDGEGLYGRVRVQKIGVVVTFEYRYKQDGKTRSSSCGKWPNLSLKEIRKLRDTKKIQRDEGLDPIDHRRLGKLQERIKQAEGLQAYQVKLASLNHRRTLSESIRQWEKLELSRRKDKGAEAIRAINKDVLPALGSMALKDISRSMILDVLDEVVGRGARVMANHLFGDLRQFYNYATAREWIDIHPLVGITKENVGGRQKERDRYLSETEIKELKVRVLRSQLPITTEIAIWVLLSTCCRVGELSKARWEDINFTLAEWYIPKSNTKNSKEHTIFLSDYCLEKFHRLRLISGSNTWCLPSRNGETHINAKSIAKQIRDRVRSSSVKGRRKPSKILLLSGGEWTPHDLRRTGATMMGEAGVMSEVIEKCLNHVEQNKLKRTYHRHELKNEQYEAWSILGLKIEQICSAI
ncbi:MAG: site-specific integrase [Deltaproteobacteria bacterium]|nr:MAG: site-specific integrase [Deltaproteobacteria bacterium]